MVAEDQSCTVAEAGVWVGSIWNWDLRWGRALQQEEQAEAKLLEETLLSISLHKEIEDSWIWMHHKSNTYKVKSAYELVIRKNPEVESEAIKLKVFRRLWGSAIPSKFTAFAWKLLSDGLPTKKALQHRRVIDQNQSSLCVFCAREDEDLEHLFFSCNTTTLVWNAVADWTGILQQELNNRWQHFLQFSVNFGHKKKKKKKKRIRHMVWVAAVWSVDTVVTKK